MEKDDKAPPLGTVEPGLSSEQIATHEEEAKRLEKLKSAAPDDTLPKVQSEQSLS